jgi:hypothetical protein
MVADPKQVRALSEDDLLGAIEECYERGWTDGLPVVPPVPGLVDRFLAHTDRPPEEVVWRMDQVRRACTVELVAINAAMAGCRPDYFPVVLAALEATVDEGWAGGGGWQSTTGGGPLLIVNGPVRDELGFNAKGNVFGPGFRANATVGRAIRLIIMNCYGIRPHELDQATQGTSGKYSLCLAENEEESPWDPLHVELGYPPEASTVSALHTRSCEFVDNRTYPDPEQLLNDIADTIARTGSLTRSRSTKRVGVIFGPEHAQFLAGRGYSKQDVKEYFAAHTGRQASVLRRTGRSAAAGTVPDDDLVRMLASPDDILIAVAGAANAGITTVAQPLGFTRHLPGSAEIHRIGLPDQASMPSTTEG